MAAWDDVDRRRCRKCGEECDARSMDYHAGQWTCSECFGARTRPEGLGCGRRVEPIMDPEQFHSGEPSE